jgi:hypothetical protein
MYQNWVKFEDDCSISKTNAISVTSIDIARCCLHILLLGLFCKHNSRPFVSQIGNLLHRLTRFFPANANCKSIMVNHPSYYLSGQFTGHFLAQLNNLCHPIWLALINLSTLQQLVDWFQERWRIQEAKRKLVLEWMKTVKMTSNINQLSSTWSRAERMDHWFLFQYKMMSKSIIKFEQGVFFCHLVFTLSTSIKQSFGFIC